MASPNVDLISNPDGSDAKRTCKRIAGSRSTCVAGCISATPNSYRVVPVATNYVSIPIGGVLERAFAGGAVDVCEAETLPVAISYSKSSMIVQRK